MTSYPLLDALLNRRSRRFAKGLSLDGGLLSYRSEQPVEPLSLDDEAALLPSNNGPFRTILAYQGIASTPTSTPAFTDSRP